MTARALPAAILAAAVLLSGCTRSPAPAPAPAAASRPNILLVTIDTLRADHVGCYGHAGAVTPTLDGLAARGVRFATAVAHAPLTGPSHACMLTGLTPLGTELTTASGAKPGVEAWRGLGVPEAPVDATGSVDAAGSAWDKALGGFRPTVT